MKLRTYLKSYFLFKTLFIWQKHYRIALAQTEEIKKRIYKFRYDIYRRELNQHIVDKLYSGNVIKDEYDDCDNVLDIYAEDKQGNIIGSIWMSVWNRQNLPDTIKEKYDLKSFNLTDISTIGEIRYFVVRKDYRKSLLGLALIGALYDFYAKHYKQPLDLTFSTCQPGLIDLYRQLGVFGYTKKIFYECGMLQIPLVCYFHDVHQSKHLNAITYHIVKYYYWYYNHKLETQIQYKKHKARLPEISFKLKNEEIEVLKHKLPTFAILLDIFGDILTNCNVLTLPKKCILMTKDIVDYDLFLLLDGTVGVYINQKLITELSPDILMGEMAFLSEDHKRYTDIICLTEAKILLIPRHVLYQLEKRNLKNANFFLKLLSKNIIKKLEITNELFLQASISDQGKH